MEIYGARLQHVSRPHKTGGSVASSHSSVHTSTSSPAKAASTADELTFSDELKELRKRDELKAEFVQKSRENKKVEEITRSRDTQKVRELEEKDLKKNAERSTLRSNNERRVTQTQKKTVSSAAASSTQTIAQPHTRVKFRTVGQTRAHKETLFNERRPVRPMNRQQYVRNLANTFALKD